MWNDRDDTCGQRQGPASLSSHYDAVVAMTNLLSAFVGPDHLLKYIDKRDAAVRARQSEVDTSKPGGPR